METAKKIIEGKDPDGSVRTFLQLGAAEQASVLDALWDSPNDHVAAFLTGVMPSLGDKKVLKQAKRLAFRLKTKGISIEEPRPSGETVLRTTAYEEAHEEKGYVTNYDGAATRAILIVRGVKRNQSVLIHGVSHFSDGLVKLAGAPLPRSQVETTIADYQFRTPRPVFLVEVSPAYAAYLLNEAFGVSGRHEAEMDQLRPFIAKLTGDVRTPEDVHRLPVPPDTTPVPLEELLGSELFAPFQLAWEGIDKDREKVRDISNPSIVLPPYMIKERTDRFMEELSSDARIAAVSGRLKRMLEDYGYLFFGLRKPGHYLASLQARQNDQQFRQLLLQFMRKSLEKKEAQEQESNLVIRPYK